MKKIGSVTIDDTYYPGEDRYSDGAIEDEMLQIAKETPASEYNRVIAKRKSWPILYHFSNVRENIVQSMAISKEDSVLEIGAGCGAITGALARKAKTVDAVDLSMKRSMINAYRHRDCDNLTIKVGNFQDIEKHLDKTYDVITLIGVFEYACSYIESEQPYEEFLCIIRRHLTKNGRLILAIENKFGLKYWAGCREDHIATFFGGIEGYAADSYVRTFAKNELEKMLQTCGFTDYTFYYPYPDYKLPEKIFSDAYLPHENELNVNHRNFDRNRVQLFDENKVYSELIHAGMFPEFSNSFLIVAKNDANSVIYTKYSNERNARFSIRTDIFQKENGGRIVRKYPDTEAARPHIEHMQTVYEHMEKQFAGSRLQANHALLAQDFIEFPYVQGETLEKQLDAYLAKQDMDGFAELVQQYVQEICKVYPGDASRVMTETEKTAYEEVFGTCAFPVSVPMETGVDVDLIFSNILLQGEDWVAIDYEWTFDFPVPVEFLLWRAGKVYLDNYGNRACISEEKMNALLGIHSENVPYYRQMELHFLQHYCYRDKRDLYALFDTMGQEIVPVDYEETIANSHRMTNHVQVYYDMGDGMSEEQSDKMIVYPDEHGEYHLQVKIPEGLKGLRIDPGEQAGVLHIWKACAYTDVSMYELSYIVNGYSTDTDEYAIDHEDPQICITNLQEKTYLLKLEYTMNTDHAELQKREKAIKHARRMQKLKGMIH